MCPAVSRLAQAKLKIKDRKIFPGLLISMLQSSELPIQETQITPPYLAVSDDDGFHRLFPLENDSSVLIGSDEDCRLHLKGENVEPKHCMISKSGEQISLRDWFTYGKTKLNGSPITQVDRIKCGDVLQIGQYRLKFVLSDENAGKEFDHPGTYEGSQKKAQTLVNDLVQSDDQDAEQFDVHQLQRELSESKHQIEQLQAALERQLELESEFPEAQQVHTAESSEVEELKGQIAFLNSQLAERDANTDLVLDQQEGSNPEYIDTEATERLVSRLEELLIELEQADQRAHGLEDLLRLSEDTIRAEQEERRHLENWVSQIESLISQKENEFASEREQLATRLNESIAAKDQLQQQLQALIRQKEFSGGDAGTERLLAQLREQNDKLRDELHESKQNERTVSQQLKELQRIVDNQEIPPSVQSKMQAMEIELAQKRAELARMRADQIKAPNLHLEHEPATKNANDADLRIRAMREHLKDVRQQEDDAKKEKQLGTRIANLWRRLGNR
jgi:pSer/pThr/pTyr-binding forkhead associated (FHA) protein